MAHGAAPGLQLRQAVQLCPGEVPPALLFWLCSCYSTVQHGCQCQCVYEKAWCGLQCGLRVTSACSTRSLGLAPDAPWHRVSARWAAWLLPVLCLVVHLSQSRLLLPKTPPIPVTRQEPTLPRRAAQARLRGVCAAAEQHQVASTAAGAASPAAEAPAVSRETLSTKSCCCPLLDKSRTAPFIESALAFGCSIPSFRTCSQGLCSSGRCCF